METKVTCPLGHECEKAVNGVLEVCAWHVEMAGNHPQTGQPIQTKKCAIVWNPILAVEVTGAARSIASAVESHRK